MVAKMRSKKTLKELLKLDLETIEAMAPNPFRFTRIDVVVSLRDPEYCKVNRAAIKATKRSYCKEDRAAIIASLKGFDVTFVMQRKLTKTDLEPNNSRLVMPKKQINEECTILAHKDAAIMRVLEARDGKGRLIGMNVGLIEPTGEVC
ncbi:hypothetical protein Ahy_B07g087330 [Arachis hypogaea]|uniref:Uncharacterized protein n=1 Tax=Arachis hypogaea TaxID=3818 RepID=A0A444YBU8_ARAHY|nr:hypothetical protein Ahy_B07g087330 [Arachis hypogaea]